MRRIYSYEWATGIIGLGLGFLLGTFAQSFTAVPDAPLPRGGEAGSYGALSGNSGTATPEACESGWVFCPENGEPCRCTDLPATDCTGARELGYRAGLDVGREALRREWRGWPK